MLIKADGVYYLGPGVSPGYAITNFRAHYDLTKRLQLAVQIDNLFNHHYYTAAQLANTGLTAQGTFIARHFRRLTPPATRPGITRCKASPSSLRELRGEHGWNCASNSRAFHKYRGASLWGSLASCGRSAIGLVVPCTQRGT